MKKRTIPRAKLHALLQEEFSKSAGDLCLACRLPMPTYFAGSRDGPNWRLPPLGECGSLCHTIAEDIAAKLGLRYDVVP